MRRFLYFFLALTLLCTLTACGGQTRPAPAPEVPESPEQPEDPDGEYTVYNCGGIEIALPTEYLEQLIVDTDFPDAPESWKPLLSVYERASVEAAQRDWGSSDGVGFLFGVLAMNQAGYEQYLCEDGSGIEVVAADGAVYYAKTFPTDVQFYRADDGIDMETPDWKDWETLSQMDGPVIEDMIRRNGLTPYDSTEFFSRAFTWEGNHAYLQLCFEDGESPYTLVLSQPVRQGEGGVWCVDRWMYEGANPILYFPDSGLPAAEYYALLQTACDSGEHPELLTPAGAAAAFVRDYFSFEPAEENLRPLDGEAEARAEADLRLREIVQKLRTGKDVEGTELLECLGRVGEDNWAALGMMEPVGLDGDWWPALLAALESAAVGGDQQAGNRDMMAFYLTIRDDLSQRREAVSALLQKQRAADGAAFAAALAEFAPEDQAYLKAAVGE